MRSQLDVLLPQEHVLEAAHNFLVECDREIELNGKIVSIPPDTVLAVKSRAFIAADMDRVILLDDHLEAVVLVGIEMSGLKPIAKYFQLKMYFTMDREFVTEDKYSPQGECL